MDKSTPSTLHTIATFCGKCDCGCPTLHVDVTAELDKRIVITDDFGQRVQMSPDQWQDVVAQGKAGALDGVLAAALV